MEFLRFAFADGWHFAGVAFLLLIAGEVVATIVGEVASAIRRSRRT